MTEVVVVVETEIVAPSVETIELLDVVTTDTVTSDLVLVESLDGTETEILTDSIAAIETLESTLVDVLTDQTVTVELIEAAGGMPGPAGPPGTSEDDAVYAKRVDFITDNLLYRGEAAVGTTDTAPLWRIRRTTFGAVDGDVTEEWAGGTALFDKAWSDRLSLTYT